MENPSIMVLDFNDSKFSFQILNFGFPISNFGFQQIVMKKNEKNIHSAWYSVIRIDTKKEHTKEEHYKWDMHGHY